MKRQSKSGMVQDWVLKQVAVPTLEFVAWLITGSIAGAFGYSGWFSVFVLLLGLSYAVKLSEGKKRLLKREFMPVFVTAGMSFLFKDPVDEICAVLAVFMLIVRLYELYLE